MAREIVTSIPTLDDALTELDHAMNVFMNDIAPLGESLRFVGLEVTMLNIQSIITKAFAANRKVKGAIVEQLRSEAEIDFISRRRGRGRKATYRLASDGG